MERILENLYELFVAKGPFKYRARTERQAKKFKWKNKFEGDEGVHIYAKCKAHISCHGYTDPYPTYLDTRACENVRVCT